MQTLKKQERTIRDLKQVLLFHEEKREIQGYNGNALVLSVRQNPWAK